MISCAGFRVSGEVRLISCVRVCLLSFAIEIPIEKIKHLQGKVTNIHNRIITVICSNIIQELLDFMNTSSVSFVNVVLISNRGTLLCFTVNSYMFIVYFFHIYKLEIIYEIILNCPCQFLGYLAF